MNSNFKSFVLSEVIIGLQYNLREQFNCLRKELRFEAEGELGKLSIHLNIEFASEGIDQLVNLVFGVFRGAIEGSVGCKVGDRAVI